MELLARAAQVECVPVALRYAFFEHERPDVLVEVGTPHAAGPLDALPAAPGGGGATGWRSATSLEGFTREVRGGSGVAERWDAVRGLRA